MTIKEQVSKLPSSPGIYLMKDSLGGIIYVGKSKNLKKRVQSYFTNSKSHSPKIKKLVQHVKTIDHIKTDTEFDALMLECDTIQRIKPMYNRKMKNPLAYSYLVIRHVNGLRRIEVSNNPAFEDGEEWYGPYTSSKHSVVQAVQAIMECFQMNCNHSHPAKGPCLNYSIGRCLGVCLGGDAVNTYDRIMDRFIGLLNGADRSLYTEIEQRMKLAAEQYDFERAAKYRDYLESADFLLKREEVINFASENHNIVMAEMIDDETETIKIFLIKRDRVLASCRYKLQQTRMQQLQTEIESLLQAHFTGFQKSSNDKVTRDEIDRAQIIYSYLQHSKSPHLIIPDEWLISGDSIELAQAIQQLLCGVTLKTE